MALFQDTPDIRTLTVCPGCDRSYYDRCPRCEKTVRVVDVERDHNPPVIAIVINPNPWLVETFGPFEDLQMAQEWALEKMEQWWPDETFVWNDEFTQYENTTDWGGYMSGIKIDVLEHPVDGK